MLLVRFMECLKNDVDRRFPRKRGFEERVAFVFDRQKQFQTLAAQGFNVVKDVIDPDDRFSGIRFASKKENIPLQAADLLAFYARRILTHQLQGKAWHDPFEQLMEERHNLLLHYFTCEQIVEFARKGSLLTKHRSSRSTA